MMSDMLAQTSDGWEINLDGATPQINRLAGEESEAIQEIVHLGLMIYTPEGFELFLTTPIGIFGGQTAMHLIETDETEQVFAALAADYEGIGW